MMTEKFYLYVGIDIGKLEHYVTILNRRGQIIKKAFCIKETKAGFEFLLKQLKKLKQENSNIEFIIGMESTSIYTRNLENYLNKNLLSKKTIMIINPIQIKQFAKMLLSRTGTDKISSELIAKYMLMLDKPKFMPIKLSEESMNLRKLTKIRHKLVKSKTQISNSLIQELDCAFPELKEVIKDVTCIKALSILEQYPTALKLSRGHINTIAKIRYGKSGHKIGMKLAEKLNNKTKESINSTSYEVIINMYVKQLQQILEEINTIETEINSIMKTHFAGHKLTTISSLGVITAATLIGKLGKDITENFKTPKQFTAYLGIEPVIKVSGKSVKKQPKMSKAGDKLCRQAIYLSTLSAIKNNEIIREYYQKMLNNNKKKMVAVGACMRKMCHLIFAIWKKTEEFVIDYEKKRRKKVA